MNKQIGVLFDLDGVLIDSESLYTEFWREIDRMYPTGIEDFAIAIKGTTLPAIMRHFPEPEVADDIVRRINEFQKTMTYPMYVGTIPFLEELNRRGIPCAIVTSSDDAKMSHLFEQYPDFPSYFTAIIDASMVTKSKPDPQGYLTAAKKIGVAIEDCYVFEDSIQGLEAGRRSGATVIGLSTTYPAERLIGKADKLITGLDAITVDEMLAVSRL